MNAISPQASELYSLNLHNTIMSINLSHMSRRIFFKNCWLFALSRKLPGRASRMKSYTVHSAAVGRSKIRITVDFYQFVYVLFIES